MSLKFLKDVSLSTKRKMQNSMHIEVTFRREGRKRKNG
jgi:hypothetical protein